MARTGLNYVLVDAYTEDLGYDQRNSRAAEQGIALLELDDRLRVELMLG